MISELTAAKAESARLGSFAELNKWMCFRDEAVMMEAVSKLIGFDTALSFVKAYSVKKYRIGI